MGLLGLLLGLKSRLLLLRRYMGTTKSNLASWKCKRHDIECIKSPNDWSKKFEMIWQAWELQK